MLIPALLALLTTVPPAGKTDYQLQVSIYRGTDTATVMFHIGEGLVGNALVERPGSFTRIRTSVRKSPKGGGCLLVNVGYAMATDQVTVDKLAISPLPVIELCDATTAYATVDNEVEYRVIVRALPAAQQPAESTPVRP